MEVYVGLDVSLKETSICVVDGSGKIVSEATVLSEPLALAEFLRAKGYLLPDFYSGATGQSCRFVREGFSLRRLHLSADLKSMSYGDLETRF